MYIDMPDYKSMTLSELYKAWISNWKTLQTGLQEIIGDSPMPDPREIAKLIVEMPEHVWTGMFESESASADLRKTMDIQNLVAHIQFENMTILNAALAKGKYP